MIKVSLTLSLVAYILFWLMIYRAIGLYKEKFGDAKNKSIGLFNHIRLFIMVLIPIMNIAFLIICGYYFIFANDEKLINYTCRK